MVIDFGRCFSCGLLLLLCCLKVLILTSAVSSEQSDINSPVKPVTSTRGAKGHPVQEKCQHCSGTKELDRNTYNSVGLASSYVPAKKHLDMISTYTDTSGIVKTLVANSMDLSSSWVIEKYADRRHLLENSELGGESSTDKQNHLTPIDKPKLERQKMREERKKNRASELVQENGSSNLKMQQDAIERSKTFKITEAEKYRIWKRGFTKPTEDSLLKYMKDQIVMAKVYASVASSSGENDLSNQLKKHILENTNFIGEADSDSDLQNGTEDKAIAIGNTLFQAKAKLYNCDLITRKLRALIQMTEETVMALKKKNLFLMEFVSFSIPKPLHCLAFQLTNEYFLHDHSSTNLPNMEKVEDPSLYHYAIFSDNVLSTWVVVNSTLMNAKEPEKHVFHIITDRLQFPAMKMWFIAHPPLPATVQVQSIDEFKWLNSSYCPVLCQLESAKMKEFYFKANHPSKLSVWEDRLKYKNPKYLSMLNHIRFYMPELFPKLDKILFLDDDVVVRKDLTALWSIDMKGMVNGAVETCKKNFHQFDSYLNFSNPEIAQKFDPSACGWAFGMNIFDLKEWRKLNLTRVYHYWQDLNKDRGLWRLGTLPPGLITFYNLTYALDKSWHLLALGYQPGIKAEQIKKSAVIHFNGNNKPWLDLGYAQFRGYWSRYVWPDDPYIRICNLNLW